ncbi:MAG: glycosyltransferase, partial [Bacteroidota bacterium]
SANRALKMAKGEIIIRMDADDAMTPNRVEERVKYLESHEEVTMVSCDATIINEDGEKVGTQVMPNYDDVEDSYKMRETDALVICAHTGFAAYKKAFDEVGGYNENIRCVVDLDLFTRMIEKGNVLIIMRQFLTKYRIYPASVVGKGAKNFLLQNTEAYVLDSMRRRRRGEAELSFDEFLKELDAEPFFKKLKRKRKYYAYYYYRNAMQSFGLKNYPKTLYLLSLAFVLRPGSIAGKVIRQLKRRMATS